MGKKQMRTPNSHITRAVRRLFMISRERSRILKAKKCSTCGMVGEVQCHHTRPIDWQRIYTVIREEILDESRMVPLCKECHGRETDGQQD